MMQRWIRWWIGGCLLWLVSWQAIAAVLEIEIQQIRDQAISVVVVPFLGEPGTQEFVSALHDVVVADLSTSGEFRVLNIQRNVPTLSADQAVDFVYWQRFGAEVLVMAQVEQDGDDFQVNMQVLDVFQGGGQHSDLQDGVLLTMQYPALGNERLRRLAHRMADDTYENLVGVPGIFSTQVAYVTTRWQEGKITDYQLQVADADGYNVQTLVTSPYPLMSPSWSPDGTRMAYVSFENRTSAIYISEIMTGQRWVVSERQGINGAPSWSPDGTQLAMALSDGAQGAPKIYILDLQTGDLRQMTRGSWIDTEPSFAPDGQSLIFTSSRGGGPQIYRLDLQTGRTSRVTFEGSYNARGSITPDGSQLVVLHQGRRGHQVAVQDLASGQLRVLTNSRLDESPTLAPNGRMVMYSTVRGGQRVLAAVSTDGRVQLLLPAVDGDVAEPAWSPFSG